MDEPHPNETYALMPHPCNDVTAINAFREERGSISFPKLLLGKMRLLELMTWFNLMLNNVLINIIFAHLFATMRHE